LNGREVPPAVQLLSLKIKLRIVTIARASTYRESYDHLELIFDAKHLGVMLGPQPLDVGQLCNFTLSGNGVVPNFNSRLPERIYNLPTELMIEVGGKTFKADFLTLSMLYRDLQQQDKLQPMYRSKKSTGLGTCIAVNKRDSASSKAYKRLFLEQFYDKPDLLINTDSMVTNHQGFYARFVLVYGKLRETNGDAICTNHRCCQVLAVDQQP
jgi:hypothetical protein